MRPELSRSKDSRATRRWQCQEAWYLLAAGLSSLGIVLAALGLSVGLAVFALISATVMFSVGLLIQSAPEEMPQSEDG